MKKKLSREELAEFKNGRYTGGPAEERAEKKKKKKGKRFAAGGMAKAGKMRGMDDDAPRPAMGPRPSGALPVGKTPVTNAQGTFKNRGQARAAEVHARNALRKAGRAEDNDAEGPKMPRPPKTGATAMSRPSKVDGAEGFMSRFGISGRRTAAKAPTKYGTSFGSRFAEGGAVATTATANTAPKLTLSTAQKAALPTGLANRATLPPGLAKRASLPPGLAKRMPGAAGTPPTLPPAAGAAGAAGTTNSVATGTPTGAATGTTNSTAMPMPTVSSPGSVAGLGGGIAGAIQSARAYTPARGVPKMMRGGGIAQRGHGKGRIC